MAALGVELGAMLAQDYWLVLWAPRPTLSKAEVEVHLESHLEWTLEQERRGVLVASGPIVGGDRTGAGHGLTVLRVGTENEARAVAATDPFVEAGLRGYEVLRWRLMEGAITVRLSFGTGTYRFD